NTVQGRKWDTGVFVPGIKYDTALDMPSVRQPDAIYARNAPNMDRAIIIEIQKALVSKGFNPGEIDGDFGLLTAAAVVDFQMSEGLLADGEVVTGTPAELGVSLVQVLPSEPGKLPKQGPPPEPGTPSETKPIRPPPLGQLPIPSAQIGIGTVNPLIMIAARM